MSKVKMVAKRAFPYANKALKEGDEFEADNEQDANVLVMVGHAHREDQQAAKRTYRRRDLRAEH